MRWNCGLTKFWTTGRNGDWAPYALGSGYRRCRSSMSWSLRPGARFFQNATNSALVRRSCGTKGLPSSVAEEIRIGILKKVPSSPEVEPRFSISGPGETGCQGQVMLYSELEYMADEIN